VSFGDGGFNHNHKWKTLIEPGNPRAEAKWKAAVDDLETMGMIEPLSPERTVFQITHGGYQAADRVRQGNDLGNPIGKPE
jgi:hypothetical protein